MEAARRFVNIATAQYETGVGPYLNVTVAETTLLGDLQTQVTLRENEMTAAVQLVQALGGGWDLHRLLDTGRRRPLRLRLRSRSPLRPPVPEPAFGRSEVAARSWPLETDGSRDLRRRRQGPKPRRRRLGGNRDLEP